MRKGAIMAEPAHEDEHVEPAYTPTTAAPRVAARPGWGTAGLIVGGFLDWFQGNTGVDLDIRAFWETTFQKQDSTFVATVGFVMIVLGLLAIVGMAPRSGWLTRFAGA